MGLEPATFSCATIRADPCVRVSPKVAQTSYLSEPRRLRLPDVAACGAVGGVRIPVGH